MSKSSSVTSVKYRKLFLGIIISIVFGIAGAVIWIFGESGVRMNGSMKDLAMVFFAVEGIPAVVFYIIWYLKDAKKRLSAAGGRASIVPFFALGVIVSFVLTVVMSIILFQKAVVFAIITFALAVIGSLISYLLAYYKAD